MLPGIKVLYSILSTAVSVGVWLVCIGLFVVALVGIAILLVAESECQRTATVAMVKIDPICEMIKCSQFGGIRTDESSVSRQIPVERPSTVRAKCVQKK